MAVVAFHRINNLRVINTVISSTPAASATTLLLSTVYRHILISCNDFLLRRILRCGNRTSTKSTATLKEPPLRCCGGGSLNNTRSALDDCLTVMTEADPNGCDEAQCFAMLRGLAYIWSTH